MSTCDDYLEILFIGGPADGQRRQLPTWYESAWIPVICQFPGPIEHTHYTKRAIDGGVANGEPLRVFAEISLSNVEMVAMLVKNYPNPKTQATP
jgi:hypothetical protein